MTQAHKKSRGLKKEGGTFFEEYPRDGIIVARGAESAKGKKLPPCFNSSNEPLGPQEIHDHAKTDQTSYPTSETKAHTYTSHTCEVEKSFIQIVSFAHWHLLS
jgi:hypothetical protein